MKDYLKAYGFNPCFNGFTSLIGTKWLQIECTLAGFNPCFNGFTSLIFYQYLTHKLHIRFQSLF